MLQLIPPDSRPHGNYYFSILYLKKTPHIWPCFSHHASFICFSLQQNSFKGGQWTFSPILLSLSLEPTRLALISTNQWKSLHLSLTKLDHHFWGLHWHALNSIYSNLLQCIFLPSLAGYTNPPSNFQMPYW